MQTLGTPGEVFYIRGILKTDTFVTPTASIGDSQMDAARPIDADKSIHQYNVGYTGQKRGTAVAAAQVVIHTAVGDGNLLQFQVGFAVAAIGDSTATFDLKKNGASVLSGTETLDNGDAAFTLTTAGIATAPYVAGDVFELVITVAAGTGTPAQGPIVSAVFQETSGV
jgi:hypothetical protein